jgi:hypothetical protein
MAAESIGNLVPTKIPGYADAADIQAALRLYHYGDYTYTSSNSNTANLVNPSIAYTINNLQTQISALDVGSTLKATDFAAKGDLLSASANDTLSVLSVGTNGQVLVANSATASGLQWATPDITLTNSVTLTNKTLTAPVITIPKIYLGYLAKTDNYTIVNGDQGYLFSMNAATAKTFSIPTDATYNFDIGTHISFVWITGAGQPTISAVTSGTTTILSNAATSTAPKLRMANSAATAIKIAANTWLVLGDLT